MPQVTLTSPPPVVPTAGAPPRLRLAQLARDAVLRVPGVLSLSDIDGHRTDGGALRVDGVRCVAAGGAYEVSVGVCCELVSLPMLAERVRSRVARAAALAGLPLAGVDVLIADVADHGHAR